MFYLDEYPENPPGFHELSTSAEWEGWVHAAVPKGTAPQVRRCIVSNLKHILVGLEMKAGLIVPHGERISKKSVLFEPYFHIIAFEFCIGVFSVCEGLGSILHLRSQGDDGSTGNRVQTNEWIAALTAEFDPTDKHKLRKNLENTKSVRDKMHQDRLGARDDIDWHDFGYKEAFSPARSAIQPLLIAYLDRVPQSTNLMIR